MPKPSSQPNAIPSLPNIASGRPRRAPWHSVGIVFSQPMTARLAMRAAGLDWRVVKRPSENRANPEGPDGHNPWELYREGPGHPALATSFGRVDRDYVPLQNSEAFGFFDPIVGWDSAAFESAGALTHGKTVWMMVKLPRDIHVAGDDLVCRYLLLSNRHGANGCVELRMTPVRVVCVNTLILALCMGYGFRIEHTAELPQRLRQASEQFNLIQRQYDQVGSVFQAMARFQLTNQMLETYLKEVISGLSDSSLKAFAQFVRQVGRILFESGRGNNAPKVRSTLWAAYNGVTEAVDHYARLGDEESHLSNLWFGAGARIKEQAFRVALRWMHNPPSRSRVIQGQSHVPSAPSRELAMV